MARLQLSANDGAPINRPYVDSDAELAAAKWFARSRGYAGRVGGWIYGPSGVAVAQGWNSFWHQRRARILDALTADQTSFATFVELVDAARQHGYTPTLIVTVARRRALAQAFDQRMYDLGLSIRAERRS